MVLLENIPGRLVNKARKDLTKIFEEFGLKITAQYNQRIVNFLDVTLVLPKMENTSLTENINQLQK